MADDVSFHLSDPLPVPRRYPSKVDTWLALVLLAAAGCAITAVVFVIANGASVWTLGLAAVPLGLIAWIVARTHYVVAETTLEARSGPFRWSIPLASIQSLSASRNPLSAPALSIDRIAVRHTGGRLLISPQQKAAFVHAMVAAVPGLEVTGLPGADGTIPAERESTFSVAGIVPAAVVLIVAFAFGGWSLYSGLREPVVTLTPQLLTIDARYGESIGRGEVVRVRLENTMPATTRRRGFSGLGRLRGIFDVEGLGPTRVFATPDTPPFIVIDTTSQPLIVNYSDPARTRELYERLIAMWGIG